MKKNFDELLEGSLRLKIFPDKNYFPLQNKIIELSKYNGISSMKFHDGEDDIKADIAQSLKINHTDSKKSKGVQMADLISGALFQHFERNNPTFFQIIKHKIKLIEKV